MVQVERQLHKVLKNTRLTENTVILKIERKGLEFRPGQHISIALPGCEDRREYTIYSGVDDPYIELLIREFKAGALSPRLCGLQPGDEVEVWGPRGDFLTGDSFFNVANDPLMFICTGTGIAPFHSAYVSYPSLQGKCHIIHGIREIPEQYDRTHYHSGHYVACVSSADQGDIEYYRGRVTDYLETEHVLRERMFFLCGNSNMIRDTFKVLTSLSVPSNHIYTEVYF